MSCNNVNTITGGSTVGNIPFYLAVQQGKVPGYSMVNKFGYNSTIDQVLLKLFGKQEIIILGNLQLLLLM